jgi:SAM-dependent methyltransferase
VERSLSLRKQGNIELLVASGAHLPFPEGMFDFVSCLSVLDCVPDPAALVGSIVKSLRRGGTLLISDPYSWSTDAAAVNKWLGEEGSEDSAAALRSMLAEQFEITWEKHAVPWILRTDSRFYQVWLNHCVMARKI